MRHLVFTLLALTATVAVAAPVPKAKAKPVELLDDAGRVLVAADEITGYEWDTHTLLLDEAAEKRLTGTKSRSFAVAVGGEVVYRGVFRSLEACSSVGEVFVHEKLPNELSGRLPLGYTAGRKADKPDPRADDRIRTALDRARKLTEKK